MRIETLYNKQFNITTFYIWKGMELVDKYIYEGEMSAEEIKKTEVKLRKTYSEKNSSIKNP